MNFNLLTTSCKERSPPSLIIFFNVSSLVVILLIYFDIYIYYSKKNEIKFYINTIINIKLHNDILFNIRTIDKYLYTKNIEQKLYKIDYQDLDKLEVDNFIKTIKGGLYELLTYDDFNIKHAELNKFKNLIKEKGIIKYVSDVNDKSFDCTDIDNLEVINTQLLDDN